MRFRSAITGLCQNEDAPGTSERDLIFGGIACQLENDSRSVAPITRKAVRHQRFNPGAAGARELAHRAPGAIILGGGCEFVLAFLYPGVWEI